MKALFLIAPNRFELRDAPAPQPGPGEALVAVRRVGLCGSDRHYLRPDYPWDFSRAPMILGHEGAGEIVALGPDVAGLRPGDRVAIDPARPCRRCEPCHTGHANCCESMAFLGYPPTPGLLREFIAYPAECLASDPSGALSLEDLMMLEPLAIALNAMDLAGFRAGWTAAVFGCGAIGLTLIAALRACGATAVLAADVRDYKKPWAERYGAGIFVNPQRDDLEAAARAAGGDGGVHVAFECAGTVAAQNHALRTVRPAGQLVLAGINEEEQVVLDLARLRRREIAIRVVRRANETVARALALAVRFNLGLAEMITHTYTLETAEAGLRSFAAYEGGVVKACVTVAP